MQRQSCTPKTGWKPHCRVSSEKAYTRQSFLQSAQPKKNKLSHFIGENSCEILRINVKVTDSKSARDDQSCISLWKLKIDKPANKAELQQTLLFCQTLHYLQLGICTYICDKGLKKGLFVTIRGNKKNYVKRYFIYRANVQLAYKLQKLQKCRIGASFVHKLLLMIRYQLVAKYQL